MIDIMNGKLRLSTNLKSMLALIQFADEDKAGEYFDICAMNMREVEDLIDGLTKVKRELMNEKIRRQNELSENDFAELYLKFEKKYNQCSSPMTYHSAFAHALQRGEITLTAYNLAKDYYGRLWNYNGE